LATRGGVQLKLLYLASFLSLVLGTYCLGAQTAKAPLAISKNYQGYGPHLPYPSDMQITVQMNATAPLEERKLWLLRLLGDGKVAEFRRAVADVPEIKQATEDHQFGDLMRSAFILNDFELIVWLNENCPDCALSQTGHNMIYDMGFVNRDQAWQPINFQTFKYVYESGGGQGFAQEFPDHSIVAHVVEVWVPEGDGISSEYTVTAADRMFEQGRHAQIQQMLIYLFEQGHDVNQMSGLDQTTALFGAIRAQDIPLTEFLLANGADPLVGRNPLATVTNSITPAFLQRLLGLQLDPNTVTAPFYASLSSTTLLGRLVESGDFNPDLLEILEAHGLDVNVVDSYGKTPIDYAVHEFESAQQPFTNYLLERGAIKTDRYYYAVLIHAIQRRNFVLLEEVLSTHPELANGLDETEEAVPLERAVWAGSAEAFAQLLDAGAVLHDDQSEFATRLFAQAISREDYPLAKLILERRPDLPVNQQTVIDGKTVVWSRALAEASGNGNVEWVQLLLDRGANTAAIEFSRHPLFGAALNGHIEVAQMLLEAGAFPNPVNERNEQSLIDLLVELNEDGKYHDMIALLRAGDRPRSNPRRK
jgi:ankyrin repeat protein